MSQVNPQAQTFTNLWIKQVKEAEEIVSGTEEGLYKERPFLVSSCSIKTVRSSGTAGTVTPIIGQAA